MKQIKLAKSISKKAHAGQYDLGGHDYFKHPSKVVDTVKHYGENYEIVAWLHDVVEDSEYTLNDLKRMGFNKSVIEAVGILTKNSSMTYDDYLSVIKANKIARKVKIADITHNSDLTRLKKITKGSITRSEKYKTALKYLNNQ